MSDRFLSGILGGDKNIDRHRKIHQYLKDAPVPSWKKIDSQSQCLHCCATKVKLHNCRVCGPRRVCWGCRDECYDKALASVDFSDASAKHPLDSRSHRRIHIESIHTQKAVIYPPGFINKDGVVCKECGAKAKKNCRICGEAVCNKCLIVVRGVAPAYFSESLKRKVRCCPECRYIILGRSVVFSSNVPPLDQMGYEHFSSYEKLFIPAKPYPYMIGYNGSARYNPATFPNSNLDKLRNQSVTQRPSPKIERVQAPAEEEEESESDGFVVREDKKTDEEEESDTGSLVGGGSDSEGSMVAEGADSDGDSGGFDIAGQMVTDSNIGKKVKKPKHKSVFGMFAQPQKSGGKLKGQKSLADMFSQSQPTSVEDLKKKLKQKNEQQEEEEDIYAQMLSRRVGKNRRKLSIGIPKDEVQAKEEFRKLEIQRYCVDKRDLGVHYKKGSDRIKSKWKERRFEVDRGILTYYDGKKMKGVVYLKNCSFCHTPVKTDPNKSTEVDLGVPLPEPRNFLFALKKEADFEVWKAALQNHSQYCEMFPDSVPYKKHWKK